MNIRAPNFISLNSFVLTSILVIFIVSFSSLASLRAPLVVVHFTLFYFLIMYKHQMLIMNKSLIFILSLVIFVVIQSIIFQGTLLIIVQSIALVLFLFFTSQIALAEGQSFYQKEQYKTLSKTLLISLPFFLVSFTSWSDFRQPGLFMNPNITSHLAMMLLPFILLGLDHRKYKILAVIIVALITVITASRSATLAFILSLLSYIFVTKFPRSSFFTLFILLATVLGISIYSVEIADWVAGNFSGLASSSDSRLLDTGYNGRDILMHLALERFESQPIIGLGFDGVKFDRGGGRELGTHNGLIETLLKFGVIGAFIFALFCLSLIWMTSKHNARFKAATIMSLAAIFSLSTNSSTFFVLNYLFIYSVLLVYIGYRVQNNFERMIPVEH
ncbi:O-antigen ligase family protein [uncultured Psychrobacter sp.]|uniref:O-antigen ligase family protein n=1 Tax=uncultured Psychrobacter sp. TaxID=259303 RepID=UPI002639DAA8|nr:O-antigen ligase family protein [uncultured Psychrobacter sp.]